MDPLHWKCTVRRGGAPPRRTRQSLQHNSFGFHFQFPPSVPLKLTHQEAQSLQLWSNSNLLQWINGSFALEVHRPPVWSSTTADKAVSAAQLLRNSFSVPTEYPIETASSRSTITPTFVKFEFSTIHCPPPTITSCTSVVGTSWCGLPHEALHLKH